MKKRFLLIPLVAVGVLFMLTSYRTGPALSGVDASMARGGNGCAGSGSCHGSASSTTVVTISLDSAGTPVTHYIAGNTYNVKISGTNTSSTSLPAAGLSVTVVKSAGAGTSSAANAGVFPTGTLPAGCESHTVSGLTVIEHGPTAGPIGPSSGTGGSGTVYSRSIPWTAPAAGTGTVVLYGVINAENVSGDATGDKWNWSSATINEIAASILPITGPTSVCPGNSITLLNGSTGGSWSSSNPAVASIDATSGVLTGVTGGTVIVTYTLTGLGSDTALITVNPATVSGTVSGGTDVCIGGSYFLTSTAAGGTWSSTSPGIASVDGTTGRIYGVSAGSCTIIYRVAGICGSTYSYNSMVVANGIVSGTLGGPAGFCEGFSTSITRTTGTGGGRWSTGTTSVATIDTTGRLYGIRAGNAIVTYTVSNSCGNTVAIDTFPVLASPPPIAGPDHTCIGQTVALTDSVTGGLWRSSNPTVAAAAAGFGTVAGVTAGTAVITYIAPSTCIALLPFTVYTPPGAITGDTAVCPLEQSVLSSTLSGGNWTSANSSIATVSSTGVVTGITNSTTTISYTMPVSGCFVSRDFVVNPNPSFIQGSPNFCANKTDSLYSLTSGGTWNSSPASVATVFSTSGVLYGIGGGRVTVTYTLPTGCFATKTVTAYPAPAPIITFNMPATTFYTNDYFVTYQWYRDGSAIPGGNTRTIGAPYDGVYTVFVTDSLGCEAMSPPYNLTNVGVHEVGGGEAVTVGPNPASDIIRFQSPVLLNATVTTVDGRVVLTANQVQQLDISSLASGAYLIRLTDAQGNSLGIKKLQKL